jgi:hypothetical protein
LFWGDVVEVGEWRSLKVGASKVEVGLRLSDTAFRKTWDREEYAKKAADDEAKRKAEGKARYEAPWTRRPGVGFGLWYPRACCSRLVRGISCPVASLRYHSPKPTPGRRVHGGKDDDCARRRGDGQARPQRRSPQPSPSSPRHSAPSQSNVVCCSSAPQAASYP